MIGSWVEERLEDIVSFKWWAELVPLMRTRSLKGKGMYVLSTSMSCFEILVESNLDLGEEVGFYFVLRALFSSLSDLTIVVAVHNYFLGM